jgi:hypothetical protein
MSVNVSDWLLQQEQLFSQAKKEIATVGAPEKPKICPCEPPANLTFSKIQDEIRELAEQKWREAGCPQGQDRELWLAAEEEMFGPHPLEGGGYSVYFQDGKKWKLAIVRP